MIDESTILYYDTHAEEYAEKTKYVYMFDIRSVFMKYLDPAGRRNVIKDFRPASSFWDPFRGIGKGDPRHVHLLQILF